MRRILVTGATGKIGCNTLRGLLERGYAVRALVMPDDPTTGRLDQFAGTELEVVHGDIAEEAVAPVAMDGVDGVVHLASNGHFARNDAHFFTNDVNGAYYLMRAAALAQPPVQRFVFASSFASYGPLRFCPVTEDHPQQPDTTLGLVKLTLERTAQQLRAAYGLATVGLRFSWVFAGEDILNNLFRTRALLRQLRAARQPTPERQAAAAAAITRLTELEDDGRDRLVIVRDRSGRAWSTHVVDVRDVVQMIVCALETPAAAGEAFNVCAPSPITYDQGVPYLADALGLPTVEVELPWLPLAEVSAARARAVLGFRPRYDFFAMVDSALALRRGEDIGIARLAP